MIKQEKILFFGGLNSDDETRFMQDGDYRYALNIRNSKSDKDSQGSIENTRGNTEVTFTLPTGYNKCIGSEYDQKNNRVIFFIYNSLSSHTIYEYDINASTVNTVIQSSILNFSKDYPILHCDIIDDLCYWVDEYNEPRKINIATAKSGGYTTINEQVISAIQYAPNSSPLAEYGSDVNSTFNKVRGKVFQFRYAYVYDDNEVSATSPISKVAIPPNQSLYDFGGYYETTLDNFIKVTLDTGNYLCKRIQVFVRDSNITDWALFKELDKEELGIADDSTYVYNFYNDSVYIPVTQASVNRLFDNVPQLAGAQSMVDGNRLVYSDVTDGYDNLTIDATATPVYNQEPPALTSKIKGLPSPTPLFSNRTQGNEGSAILDAVVVQSGFFSAGDVQLVIQANTVNDTDVWNVAPLLQLFNTYDPSNPVVASFRESFSNSFPTNSTSLTIATYFANEINTSTSLNGTFIINADFFSTVSIVTTATVVPVGSDHSINIHFSMDISYVNFPYPITSTSSAQFIAVYVNSEITRNIIAKTFKRNSKQSFALAYYDNPNRSGVCQVTDDFDVNILSYSQTSNKGSVDMDITISSLPPSWATHYQILYTGNRSVSNYLQIDTGTVSVLGSQLKVYINTIGVYNTQSGGRTSLSYSWTKGDRVTFISYGANIYFNEFYDLEITSSDTDGGGQYILVPNVLPVTLTNGTLIELYTPKLNQDQVFYWEIGEVYSITGGYHKGGTQNQTATLPAVTRVNSGDSYYRFRGYNTDSFIEDFSLSDLYASDSWDKGRFNIVDKDFKRTRRYATSYYSEQYIPDTNINGLSTIYDLSFHEANKNYGAIQKTYADQDRLLFVQETHTGFSLVNKSVLYNSSGTPNGTVGQESQVLSEVQYYSQSYGCGTNPESFAVYDNRKYFVDPNKGAVLRLSNDGFTPISDYKYHVFFQDLFNQRKNVLKAFLGKIWGVFDRRTGEYVVAFEKCAKPDQISTTKDGSVFISPGEVLITADTLGFSEDKKRWVTHYSFAPEMMVSNGIDIISWKQGKMYLHNKSSIYNNFYGEQSDCQVTTVSNQEPSNIKFYTSIYQETTDTWEMVATNQFGQETNLISADFELIEGVYYAALLKDANTPNVSIPLLEGDDMRCHSMEMALTNSNTGFVKLFAITVRYGNSELTNK